MKSLPRFSVENPVLVNLLMVAMIIGGGYTMVTMVREMFPESRPNRVMISTPYPGATPAEIEKGISKRIEEEIKRVEGIDKIETRISEGLSLIVVTLDQSRDDIDVATDEFETTIAAIPRQDLPEDAESTMVAKLEPKLPVIAVALFGDVPEPELKDAARNLRDDLLRIPGISDVEVYGTRKDELIVEVDPDRLIEYGVSIGDVSEAIRRTNLELPGGTIRTSNERVAVRTLGETDEAARISETIVRASPTGQIIRVSDLGRVIDGFVESDVRGRFNGKPSAGVTVFKTEDQDAIDISQKVRAYTRGRAGMPMDWDWLTRAKNLFGVRTEAQDVYDKALRDRVPENAGLMNVMTHTDLARFIEGRLDLLTRNGVWGLGFVFLSLFVFLNWRVAIWVLMGLVVSVCGAAIVMTMMGTTLNLITMFGLIVVIGLLVDDAIVVGENIYTRVEHGETPELAAIRGAEEVTWPVVITVTTTIGAFLPLMFIEGQLGDFMGVLPMVVMAALSVSLVESLVILPSHLADNLKPIRPRAAQPSARRRGIFSAARDLQENGMRMFVDRVYDPILRVCVSYRYVTLATVTATLMISLGLIAGHLVPFVLIQKTDSDILIADIEMPIGSPVEATDKATHYLEGKVLDIPEVKSVFSMIGMSQDTGDSSNAGITTSRSHIGQLLIELEASENRKRHSADIIQEMRDKTADFEGPNALVFRSVEGGPGGKAIEIEVTGPRIGPILVATEAIKTQLATYAGVHDIDDDYDEGRREVQVELLDSARSLGLTTETLAMQVRGAFYGLEARTLQRDGEDVDIRVRYPEDRRANVYEVDRLRVATPLGGLVPLQEVAKFKDARGFTSIRRVDQRQAVVVTADVDQKQGNAEQILASLTPMCREMEADYGGLEIAFEGNARETVKSLSSLKRDFPIALMIIFVMLAGLFRSYVQPMVVMSAIPFAIIGAVWGHFWMGYPMTILSMIGVVALSGIVVNDSLILVDFINRQRESGVKTFEAVIQSGRRRLRPILLTSITTILGLAPMMAEQSFQAKFLIPMAISLTFGLAFATILTLIIVPALYMIVEDVRLLAVRIWNGPPERKPWLA